MVFALVYLASTGVGVLLVAGVLLLLPFRWGLRLALAPVIELALRLRLEPPVPDPGAGYMLGVALLGLIGLAAASALAVRAGYEAWGRRYRNRPGPAPAERLALGGADTLLGAAAGLVLGLQAVAAAGWQLTGAPVPPYLLHAVLALAGLAAAAAALPLAGRLARRLPALRPAAASTLAAAGLTVAGIAAWGALWLPDIVQARAAERAGDAPSCIALMRQNREVASRADLTFFGLDKMRHSPHAVLLVDDGTAAAPTAYLWSFHTLAFAPLPEGSAAHLPAIPCLPAPPSADARVAAAIAAPDPGTVGGPAATIGITLGAARFAIPAGYRPRVAGRAIFLDATPPAFDPAPLPDRATGAGFEPGNGLWLAGFVDEIAEAGPAQPDATGLTRSVIDAEARRLYAVPGEGGVPLTVIDCLDSRPEPIRCQHRFRRDGDLYSFEAPESLVPQWKESEAALVARFRDFAAAAR